MDYSQNFLIAFPSESTAADLTRRAGAAPIKVNTLPIIYLSPPTDRDSVRLSFQEDSVFNFTVNGQGFVFNPNTQRTEFCLFFEPELPSLLSDAGVDVLNFQPYASLAIDPMRTAKIRFWLKNFGDSLFGVQMAFSLSIRSDRVLHDFYNPALERDHPMSFSDAL